MRNGLEFALIFLDYSVLPAELKPREERPENSSYEVCVCVVYTLITRAHMEGREHLRVSFLRGCLPFSLGRDLSLVWNWSSRLG